MRSERFQRAKAIVANALQQPPEHRARYVQDACGDDLEMRREVESLLSHDAHTPTLLVTGGLAGARWDAVLQELAPERPESEGTRIGPYEIVGELGRGGMGTVYRARQVEPVRREVAIKLIKGGLDGRRITERFEVERQTLAVLEHSGIAKMLDAGADDQGRPYFVMELVRGVPITEYADARRLSIDDRLALFLQVCQAVQHAHQKGILHRDLKPSNILVTEEDGSALPKVIDFGVAKAIDASADVSSPATELGQFVGTPDYMSPEQASAQAGAVDTRSDVYSLGVLLYELLTGRRPHRLTGLPVVEIQRVLGGQDPAAPSAALRADEKSLQQTPSADAERWARAVAEARSSGAGRLRRTLAGDLDNIVLKCLRKEPERRYASVDQLAADIGRHLRGVPVEARPDTWSYRTTRFVQRHRALVAGIGVVFLALALGLAGTLYGLLQANDARRQAELEAATAQQAVDFLDELFRSASPFDSAAPNTTLQDILDAGSERLNSLDDQPLVKARLLLTMGNAYSSLGQYEKSERVLDEAMAIRQRENGPLSVEAADVSRSLAVTYLGLGRFDEAIDNVTQALEVFAAQEPLDSDLVADAAGTLTDAHMRAGRFDEALAAADRGFELTRTASPSPQLLSELHGDRGAVLSRLGRREEALEEMLRSLEIIEAAERPGHPAIAQALSDLGAVYAQSGRLAEAADALERALEINEGELDPDSPFFAVVLHNLGALNLDMERFDIARGYLERAITARETTYGPDHPAVTSSLNNLAKAHAMQGRFDEALALYERSARIRETALGPEHPALGLTYQGLGVLHSRWERFPESADYFERAIAIFEINERPDLAPTLRLYSEALRAMGRDAEADAALARAAELDDSARD